MSTRHSPEAGGPKDLLATVDDLTRRVRGEQRVRLGILAVAQQAKRVEFTYLRSTLGLTAGNLSST